VSFTDVRTLDEHHRWIAADRARAIPNLALPRLAWWNYSPCAEHLSEGVQSWCLDCGVEFRRHQNQSVAWQYYAKRGLLGDGCGLGKTMTVLGVMAMCAETGELGHDEYAGQRRTLIICQAAAVNQWRDEIIRTIPRLNARRSTWRPGTLA
jgi:SNF2 family DNA or RNA helicase